MIFNDFINLKKVQRFEKITINLLNYKYKERKRTINNITALK